MDSKSLRGGEIVIDVDNVGNETKENESLSDRVFGERHTNKDVNRSWGDFATVDGPVQGLDGSFPNSREELIRDNKIGGKENAGLLKKNVNSDKPKKKSCKKPPRPPRPPKAPSLDAADEKIVREITELAMLKRARIERMKALKKMKNSKGTSSCSNLWALIITILFCCVILWQGLCSRNTSNLSFEGSPISSVQARGELISVQFLKNASGSKSDRPSSASPNIVEQVSGWDSQR